MALLTLHGITLSGQSCRLPEDLPDAPVALVFGFAHDARQDVRAWKQALEAQGHRFLSCPATVDDLSARALVGVAEAMKLHVPPAAWDGIVQVHRGGHQLLKAMHWLPDAHAKVIVTDRSGHIHASHGGGAFTDEAFQAIHAAFPRPPA